MIEFLEENLFLTDMINSCATNGMNDDLRNAWTRIYNNSMSEQTINDKVAISTDIPFFEDDGGLSSQTLKALKKAFKKYHIIMDYQEYQECQNNSRLQIIFDTVSVNKAFSHAVGNICRQSKETNIELNASFKVKRQVLFSYAADNRDQAQSHKNFYLLLKNRITELTDNTDTQEAILSDDQPDNKIEPISIITDENLIKDDSFVENRQPLAENALQDTSVILLCHTSQYHTCEVAKSEQSEFINNPLKDILIVNFSGDPSEDTSHIVKLDTENQNIENYFTDENYIRRLCEIFKDNEKDFKSYCQNIKTIDPVVAEEIIHKFSNREISASDYLTEPKNINILTAILSHLDNDIRLREKPQLLQQIKQYLETLREKLRLADQIIKAIDQKFKDINIKPPRFLEIQARQHDEEKNDEEKKKVKIVDAMQHWSKSTDDNKKRVFYLLGDYGSGKTTTCKMLQSRLIKEFEKNNVAAKRAIIPIYLDIKELLKYNQFGITQLSAATTDKLIEIMLSSITPNDIKLTSTSVIAKINKYPCLVIFDGFDEVVNILSSGAQQRLVSSLLMIFNNATYATDIVRLESNTHNLVDNTVPINSSIVITCRTHFFRRDIELNSFFYLDLLKGNGVYNYCTYSLLQLTPEQCKEYINKFISDGDELENVNRAIDNIFAEKAIHKPLYLGYLREFLSSRPSLLNDNTNDGHIYDYFFERATQRDSSKNIIKQPRDRKKYLSQFALNVYLGQDGFDIDGITDFISNVVIVSNPLYVNEKNELVREFCNSSMLNRNDDTFCFDPPSFYPYFIALGLYNDISNYNNGCDYTSYDIIIDQDDYKERGLEELFEPIVRFFICNYKKSNTKFPFKREWNSCLANSNNQSMRQFFWRILSRSYNLENPIGLLPFPCNPNLSGLTINKIHFTKDNFKNSEKNYKSMKFDRDSKMISCHFVEINFKGIELDYATFEDCIFKECSNFESFEGCTFENCTFENTSFENINKINNVKLIGCTFTEKCKFPEKIICLNHVEATGIKVHENCSNYEQFKRLKDCTIILSNDDEFEADTCDALLQSTAALAQQGSLEIEQSLSRHQLTANLNDLNNLDNVALSPNNTFLATADKQSLRMWFIHHHDQYHISFQHVFSESLSSSITAFTFSTDSSHFAVAINTTLRIFKLNESINEWQHLTTIDAEEDVNGLAFSPDNLYLVGGGDYNSNIYALSNIDTPKDNLMKIDDIYNVNNILFINNSLMITDGVPKPCLWECNDDQYSKIFKFDIGEGAGHVLDTAYSHSNDLLLLASSKVLTFWSMQLENEETDPQILFSHTLDYTPTQIVISQTDPTLVAIYFAELRLIKVYYYQAVDNNLQDICSIEETIVSSLSFVEDNLMVVEKKAIKLYRLDLPEDAPCTMVSKTIFINNAVVTYSDDKYEQVYALYDKGVELINKLTYLRNDEKHGSAKDHPHWNSAWNRGRIK